MNRNSPYTQLVGLINSLNNEDHILGIHVLNKDYLEYKNNRVFKDQEPELIQQDINDIKTANNSNDFKNIILNKIRDLPDFTLNHLF